MVRRRPRRTCALSLESLERRDCPAGIPTVVVEAGSTTIDEAGGFTLVNVRLSSAATSAVKVGYIVTSDGVAAGVASTDYRLSIGPRGLPVTSGTIEFSRGESVKQVRVTAVDDGVREGAEVLRFGLFRPLGCTIGATQQVDVTVQDNDDYTASIERVGDSQLNEGAEAQCYIRLTKPATRAETFYVSTLDASARAGTFDYRPIQDLPVTILVGQSQSRPFRVATANDSVSEGYEHFLVTARSRSADMPPIDPVGVTINRNDGSALPGIMLSVSSPSLVEGDFGTQACVFTVGLSSPVPDGQEVRVNYATADGTALAGSDYVAVSGQLVFAPGQIAKTVVVPVKGDGIAEYAALVETFRLTASATIGGVPMTAFGDASIEDNDSAFQISVRFPDNSLTRPQQQIFQLAAARWSQIIVGDLPDVAYAGRVIDDIEITATAPRIDGKFGILGQAGPTEMRPGAKGLPYLGAMAFDSADVEMMMQEGTFYGVILHEMAHVLGFGTLWSSFGLLTGAGGTNPQYRVVDDPLTPQVELSAAVAEYRALTGNNALTTVPVENSGGTGTRDGHWRESVFDNELMTGYAEPRNVPMAISRLTVGAFQDLGYAVRFAAADPYAMPGSIVAPAGVAGPSGLGAAVTMALEQASKPTARAAAFSRLG